ncbi:MAG: oligosaccharide flippase family protein [Lentimicrobiaceae bacterium]|jgi:O-antigen/teichoic acid export membrane protein
MSKENLNSYNQIAKATSILGGVQVFNILISIIRSKFIAVLLGAAGVGIIGLYTSTTNMVIALTSLGINFSGVRTISQSFAKNNIHSQSRAIIILRRWAYLTGITGTILTLIFSKQLSRWVFGSEDYKYAFIFLSITLLFQSINGSQQAILQGMQRIKLLAKANLIGSFVGLCISIPLYYILGINGIVPSLILIAVVTMAISLYYASKIVVEKVRISIIESFHEGLEMVKLGTVIMITNLVLLGVLYLVQLFINRTGGIEQVGLYVASTTIISGYIGLVFSSMLPDFLPRLSSVSNDTLKINKLVNQQTEIAILILGPILILLLSTLPIVIKILYDSSFLPVTKLIQWSIPGILFMAANWTSSIMIIAKGDFKLFLIIELSTDVIILLSNTILYHYFQLEGIGIASLINNVTRLFFQLSILKFKYSFSFENSGIKLFLIQLVLTTILFLFVLLLGYPKSYFIGVILLMISLTFSYFEINKRIEIRAIFKA